MMRHITIKNRYEFDANTNHGGSTELEKGEVLDGDVDKRCWLIAAVAYRHTQMAGPQ